MDVKLKQKKSQQGMAILETVPMIFVFVALVGFTIGFYGVTQKMILHSIASRAYGFEQIRHRANTNYLRDVGTGGTENSYHLTQLRYFTTRAPGTGDRFIASRMGIDYRDRNPADQGNPDSHNTSAYQDINRSSRNERHLFNSVWIKVGHGLCLRASCGE